MDTTSQSTENRGCFISFEGLDGCGKSTQIKKLTEYLAEKHLRVLQVREPGGCRISEKIRDILLQKSNAEMSPNTELLLYWAARAQLLHEAISPALASGTIVLADRFGWSTFAYQGYGRGMDLNHLSYLRTMVCGNIWPDHSFFLDIPLEEMKKRSASAHKTLDRMELQADGFFTRTRNGYLTLAKENPHLFTVLDGTALVDTIKELIIQRVESLIEGKKTG